MKRINYVGSITEDLDILQNEENLSWFDVIIEKPVYVFQFIVYLLSIVIIKSAFKRFSWATAIAITTSQPVAIVREINNDLKELKKKRKEVKQKVKEFAKTIQDDDENLYKAISHSVVLENIDKKEEIDRYIEYITSDIFYIDGEDKIAVLREVKAKYNYKDSDVTVSSTDLYQLEEEDIPPKDKLPVKQVLRLR